MIQTPSTNRKFPFPTAEAVGLNGDSSRARNDLGWQGWADGSRHHPNDAEGRTGDDEHTADDAEVLVEPAEDACDDESPNPPLTALRNISQVIIRHLQRSDVQPISRQWGESAALRHGVVLDILGGVLDLDVRLILNGSPLIVAAVL